MSHDVDVDNPIYICSESSLIFSLCAFCMLKNIKYLQSSLVCWWDRFRWCWGNSMIFYIRQIPGGNNSLWQAWNTQHVILRQKRKKKERSCRCDGGKANRHGRLTGLVDGTTQLFRFFFLISSERQLFEERIRSLLLILDETPKLSALHVVLTVIECGVMPEW